MSDEMVSVDGCVGCLAELSQHIKEMLDDLMMKSKTNYLHHVLLCLVVVSCADLRKYKKDLTEVSDDSYKLNIYADDLRIKFSEIGGATLVPDDTISGLFLNGSAVVKSDIQSKSDSSLTLIVKTMQEEKAMVRVLFQDGIASITVSPESEGINRISMRFGGMPVAHGLGDAGAFGENFNLVANESQMYEIANNGGTKRWLSTFVIFPKNYFAGVFFDRGKKSVVLGKNTYQLHTEREGQATFYFFLGTHREIYAHYKKVRESLGMFDVRPKSRLFELGWESWDALGWNTNQQTVQDVLSEFHEEGYPVRWAVTGSGFWEEGGTTTNFGKWGKKFPDADFFRSWMHQMDVKWMIGLRTNFVPDGGPYVPISDKRDRNLKGDLYHGNHVSDEGLQNGYFVSDADAVPLTYTSRWFPQVPCYLLDGRLQEASHWYVRKYEMWKVDGIKEDTMMDIDSLVDIYNNPIERIAQDGGLVMARNGSFVSPGTLLRINDTRVADMSKRTPINYLQYAACGYPNVYSDVAGIHNIHNLHDVDASIRHAWMLSLTAGMAVGAIPSEWPEVKQEAYKKAVDFHVSLVPYLFSAAMKSYESGFPYTMTPLDVAFEGSDEVVDVENFQWMVGESILATPLLKDHSKGHMDIDLPPGIWVDWNTGEKFDGPGTLTDYTIPLENVPCFVGGNGVVITRNTNSDRFTARVYPVGKKSETLFYTLRGAEKYMVTVSTLKHADVKVMNRTTNSYESVSHQKGFVEFDIVEGQDYLVMD